MRYKTKKFSINAYDSPPEIPEPLGRYKNVQRKDIDVIIFFDDDYKEWSVTVRNFEGDINNIISLKTYYSERDALDAYNKIDMNFVIKAYSDKQQYLHNNKTL